MFINNYLLFILFNFYLIPFLLFSNINILSKIIRLELLFIINNTAIICIIYLPSFILSEYVLIILYLLILSALEFLLVISSCLFSK